MSIFKRFTASIKLGIILGVFTGLGRVAFFLYHEGYRFQEIQPALINLIESSVNHVLFLAVVAAVCVALAWSFYERLEGLMVAGLVTGLLFLPTGYYLNKNHFPGVKEMESVIGNGVLLLLALVLTIMLHKRWTQDVKFFEKITHKYVFFAAVVLLGLANFAFALQPAHRKLGSVHASPDELVQLFDLEKLKQNLPESNGHSYDLDDPAQLLKHYFRQKTSERLQKLRNKVASQDSADIVAYADSALHRQLTFVDISRKLPKRIDWRNNPTNDKVWIHALNRHEWLWELAAAYSLTGDVKYAEGFEAIMSSWFEQNPMLAWKDESDPAWRLIDSSLRMTSCWIDAFDIFFGSDHVSEQFKWRMLASFHEHAQFLMHFRSPGRNHLLQETFGLMAIAGVFSEFKMSDQWLQIANSRLDDVLRKEIYPDGGYNELSTFYHRFVIRILQQIADFAEANDIHLSGYFYRQLERMYTFLMHVARPDGMMPQINDGFRAKELRILYEKPAKKFARDDFRYFGSNGAEGEEPEKRSVGFPYSGLYVMRSDWSEDARYMIVDAGPFGSAHGHEDKLSFELFAFGRPFIVESGTYTYKYNRWHRYFESSFAHNTVVVDNRSQLRLPFEERWTLEPNTKLPNIWISNETFDYLEASYNEGYGNRKEDILTGIEHTRRILFVKPDYWILWDTVKGHGDYSVNQLFHFPPDVHVEERGSEVAVAYKGGPELLLRNLNPDRLSLRKTEGTEQPIQGWISPEYGTKLKAPVIDLESSGELPHVFINLLIPFEGSNESNAFECRWLSVMQDGRPIDKSHAIAIAVNSRSVRDFILIAPNMTGEKRFGQHVATSQLVVIRKYRDGREAKMEIDDLAEAAESVSF